MIPRIQQTAKYIYSPGSLDCQTLTVTTFTGNVFSFLNTSLWFIWVDYRDRVEEQ